MRVVIKKETLKLRRACDAAYTSPEWDETLQALVYSDFDKTVKRLMSTPEGVKHLAWHVHHKHVPMTQVQFESLKKKAGISQ